MLMQHPIALEENKVMPIPHTVGEFWTSAKIKWQTPTMTTQCS